MTAAGTRKKALLRLGTLSPSPWDLPHLGQNVCSMRETLERGIRLRGDATRAPLQAPEWQGTASTLRPSQELDQTRQALANKKRKLVLTQGATIGVVRGFRDLYLLKIALASTTKIAK